MRGEIIAVGMVLAVLGATLAGINYLDLAYQEREGVISLTAQVPTKGGWEPSTLRVKVGQVVRLRLTSRDVTHGFLLPDFNVKSGPVSPGEFTTVEFVADRAGTFKFYCNILCSRRHGSMNGELIVEVEGSK